MKDVLIEFLRAGALGALRVGSSTSEVLESLGPAWLKANAGSGTTVWKYGPLEVTVRHDRVATIGISCFDEQAHVPAVLQGASIPASDATLYGLIEKFDECGVAWMIDEEYTFDRQLCLRTEGGVRVCFDLDHRELQSLKVQ